MDIFISLATNCRPVRPPLIPRKVVSAKKCVRAPHLQSNLSSSGVARSADRAQDGVRSLEPPSLSQNKNDISLIH